MRRGEEVTATVRNVMIFAGVQGGALSKAGLEMLTAGRELAGALGVKVDAVLVGAGAGALASDLAARGAATVYVADDPALAEFVPDLYLPCVESAVKQADPGVILFCADPVGRDLAPRLAHRLGAALVTEAVRFAVEGGQVNWTRPVYGGKAMAVMHAARDRQVVTVRARTFDPAEPAGAAGEVTRLAVHLDPATAATRVVDHIREATEGVRLEDAKIVVSGGRGLGGPEPFKELEVLAKLLGGAVGASRAACDAGWVPPSWQVGQTGKTVAPDLYIAIGISGASQHLAGITAAKNVIAINKDPEAPIFKRANLGIVADYKQVLPHLIERARQLAGQ